MSSVLVFVDSASTSETTMRVLWGAQSLVAQGPYETLTVLCLGQVPSWLTREGPVMGVDSVLQVAAQGWEEYVVVPQAQALAAAMRESAAEVVLLEDSHRNRDIAAYAAALVDAAVVTGAAGCEGKTAVKAVLGNRYSVWAAAQPGRALIATVRPRSFEQPAPPVSRAAVGAPAVLELTTVQEDVPAARVRRREPVGTEGRPALDEAQIVVAGGRGTNGDFGPLEDLADALGAAVGASRVATDEGWVEHNAQVGQTGVTVSPKLYISAGISGAIQQKTGMQGSEVIVAVNTDPDAPVFEIADFGVVGDLAQVLPQAAAEIRRRGWGV